MFEETPTPAQRRRALGLPGGTLVGPGGLAAAVCRAGGPGSLFLKSNNPNLSGGEQLCYECDYDDDECDDDDNDDDNDDDDDVMTITMMMINDDDGDDNDNDDDEGNDADDGNNDHDGR